MLAINLGLSIKLRDEHEGMTRKTIYYLYEPILLYN